MTPLSTEPEVQHPYVTRKPGVAGGKPIIAGTRMKVSFVAREHVEMDMSPLEILEAHPHLTLAKVHGAHSYYYDHEAEIQAELREADEMIEKLRQEAGESPFVRRMRAAGKLP